MRPAHRLTRTYRSPRMGEQEQQEEPSLGGAPSPKDEEVEEGRAADESVSEGVQEELAEQLGVE